MMILIRMIKQQFRILTRIIIMVIIITMMMIIDHAGGMEVHLLGLEWRGNEVTLPSISRGGTLPPSASDPDYDDDDPNIIYLSLFSFSP